MQRYKTFSILEYEYESNPVFFIYLLTIGSWLILNPATSTSNSWNLIHHAIYSMPTSVTQHARNVLNEWAKRQRRADPIRNTLPLTMNDRCVESHNFHISSSLCKTRDPRNLCRCCTAGEGERILTFCIAHYSLERYSFRVLWNKRRCCVKWTFMSDFF